MGLRSEDLAGSRGAKAGAGASKAWQTKNISRPHLRTAHGMKSLDRIVNSEVSQKS
jgi:hypothetical protein